MDLKPKHWEDRITLFVGYLIDQNKKSQTVKSYISAIKAVLCEINVKLDPDTFLLSALTRACKFKNDVAKTRLPLRKTMVNVLAHRAWTHFLTNGQRYLAVMYSALISTVYYGLFRIRELTTGSHPIKVTDVHIGRNKKKFLMILRSSKTHSIGDRPQSVKLTSTDRGKHRSSNKRSKPVPVCPFDNLQRYINVRPKFKDPMEPFFVFGDRTPIKPEQFHRVLKQIIQISGFDPKYYEVHGLRTGRAQDLLNMGFQ